MMGMSGQIREPLRELANCCSLPAALEAMGERWSFLILRASFNGLHHFEEFQSELGIARNILANRLNRLDNLLEGFGTTVIAMLVREGRV